VPPSPTVRTIVRWLPLAFGLLALSAAKHTALPDRPFGKALSRDEPESVHSARAREPGRGRTAKAPWHIPWTGWEDIFWRTYRQIGEDRLLAVAAGVVFYGLLALFPAVTALVSFYGLFADWSTIADNLAAMAIIMPSDAIEIVRDQVARVLSKGEATLSLSFAFGLAFALWSANAGMKAIIDALNVVYEETEKRGLIRFNLVSLAFTLGAILVALLSLAFVVLFPLVLARVGLGPLTEAIIGVVRWPALLVLIILGLAIIYRYGPSRRIARWQWISIGSLLACVLWMLGSAVFSWYLASFANYDATYGALGAVIGMMMWMWLSVIVILAGAELNSEIEHQTAEDSTVGLDQPLGARGATMADTVGDAQ
jgi:membrane protein